MKSTVSLICCALRVAVPSVSSSAVRLARPPFPLGSRRDPASTTTRTITIGKLRCSDTSSTAPFGSLSSTTAGPSAKVGSATSRLTTDATARQSLTQTVLVRVRGKANRVYEYVYVYAYEYVYGLVAPVPRRSLFISESHPAESPPQRPASTPAGRESTPRWCGSPHAGTRARPARRRRR